MKRHFSLATLLVVCSASTVFGQGFGTNAQSAQTGQAAVGGTDIGQEFGGEFTFDSGGFGGAGFGGANQNAGRLGGLGGGLGGFGGGLGGFGGGLGGFGGGFGGGGFGGGGFGGQGQQNNQSKIRATVKLGFTIERPPAEVRARNVNATLRRLPLPKKFQSVNVSIDGGTAIINGAASNVEDVDVLKQLLLLEPGVYDVRFAGDPAESKPAAESIEPAAAPVVGEVIRVAPAPGNAVPPPAPRPEIRSVPVTPVPLPQPAVPQAPRGN